MSQETKSTFDEWALVELFGHARIVGKVTEATISGGAFIRVDVPDKDGNTVFTRFFGPGAIYSMSPIDRDTAIALAQRQSAEPVKQYELPAPRLATPDPDEQVFTGHPDEEQDDDGVF
jgi:hypothetical protein